MNNFILVLLTIFLFACTPEVPTSTNGGNSRGTFSSFWGNSNTNNTSTGSSSSTNTSSNISADNKWYYKSQYYYFLTIDSDFNDTFYLKGQQIHNYLSASTNYKTHCVKIKFGTSSAKPLVARLLPYSSYQSGGYTEKYFRLNLGDANGSMSTCSSEDDVAYQVEDVCETCQGSINTASFEFYTADFGNQLNSQVINGSKLTLKINMNNDTTNNNNYCTNEICKAQGFDCCLSGQCVIDGATKQSAINANPESYSIIAQIVKNNPSAYAEYPEYYYVCSSSIPTDPTTTGGSTGGTTSGSNGGNNEAQEQLQAMINDYMCVNEMKEKAISQPFHENPINEEEEYTYCDISDNTLDNYFENVMVRMYQQCGCTRTELLSMIQNCPNYEYRTGSMDSQGNPTSIVCYTPPVEVDVPFQNLSLAVNSRSAPHRFFAQDGTNYDELSNVFGSQEIMQEGEPFVYQDTTKTMPLNGSFNMNSILGQMSVNLDQTLPAKMVKVNYDEVYIIGTTNGYYTPCPSCARDSWFSPFTSNPSSANGVGVRSVGYTTSRDTWGNNSSYGNYEDTIFGRACWVPPTMLPFSFNVGDDQQSQRQTRLATQAALFTNGYQRDWFGFNKGALIGSFDGVTWFAIGKGRIVRATSDKLFLAINAPFADLAEPTNHTVSIKIYEGVSSGASKDYDPNLAIDHPSQNEAGSCQQHHMCESDTDCITRLGWEYVCTDVKSVYTGWPVFDTEGNEIEGDGKSVLLEQILQQGTLPNGSTKRCVYRGAGAPCRKDYESVANESVRKALACAPNFYCAGLEDEVYNSEVARYTGVLENLPLNDNHLFGQDANVLGRPLYYVTGPGLGALPEEVVANIGANIQLTDEEAAGNEGLCRPGKALPSGGSPEDDDLFLPHEQHKIADEEFRTDYISQIGGCNSSNTAAHRFVSCPVLDEEGNYSYTSNKFFSDLENDTEALANQFATTARTQNSCGGESLADDINPFNLIEAPSLANVGTIVTPTFAMDACFRRAGSVCHTDLDCSPNKYHRDNAQLYTTAYFGNIAEQKYWEEYLVCSQAQPKPSIYDANYKDYDMSKNRCCREVGNDLTIYSEKIPDVPESENISTVNFSYMSPSDETRYSRFSVADDMQTPISGSTNLDDDAHILTPNQWKAVGQVAARTCCGGGWVRKFADGTNNWKQTGRLSVDVTKFKCINYQSPIVSLELAKLLDGISDNITMFTNAYNREYSRFCTGTGSGEGENGCMESGVSNKDDDFLAIAPTALSVDTQTVKISDKFTGSSWAPYKPLIADGGSSYVFDFSKGGDSGQSPERISGVIKYYIPAYMGDGEGSITSLDIKDVEENESTISCSLDTNCSAATSWGCKYCIDKTAGTITVNVDPQFGTSEKDSGGSNDNKYRNKDLHVIIKFDPPGKDQALEPGNYLYYLYKLSRLELIGIPQVHFEPMVCTNNKEALVPGIFKEEMKTMASYESSEYVFNGEDVMADDDTNPSKFVSAANSLQHDAVFSSHEFMCCQQLGQVTTAAARCCSGHAVENKTTKKLECKLPTGTDLNVYFNRFVTSEGNGDDAPGGGFNDETDFDANTGEPKASESVYKKLSALGKEYCESAKTRRGAAFGLYNGEPLAANPVTNTNATIVDSYTDNGTSTSSTGNGGQAQSGYAPFYQGFRWNHHIYCE